MSTRSWLEQILTTIVLAGSATTLSSPAWGLPIQPVSTATSVPLSQVLFLTTAVLFVVACIARVRHLQGIVARHRAQLERLTQSEARLQARLDACTDELEMDRHLLGNISLGLTAWRPDGACLVANDASGRILGGTRDDVLRQNFRQLPSWKATGMLAAAEDVLASGGYREMDIKTTTTLGKDVWINCRLTTFARNGQQHLLMVIDDVRDQREAEADLRWKEALLSQMAGASPLAFLVVDNRTDDILYFNDCFCAIWGLHAVRDQMARHELKNNDIIPHCIPHLADVEAFAASCKPLQDTANRVVVEDEIPFRDGRTIRRFTCQIRDENDAYLGRFYLFEDITRKKHEARLLERQTALLTGLRDSIPDIVFFKDLRGVYLGCNPEFARMVGRSPDAIIGGSDYDLFPHELAEFFRERDRITLEQGVTCSNEEWVTYPDGHQAFLDTYKAPLRTADGTVIGLVGIARDITLKAKAESALREATKAAVEASAAKSEFLANMSHEIRSPMNGVIGASDLLLGMPLEGEQRELAGIIKLSATSLLSLINDILDLSKIEARRLEFEQVSFELSKVLSAVIDLQSLPAAERYLGLHLTIDPQADLRVVGDPGRLRQVLLNLVNNALKFTLEGEVSVEVKVIDKSTDKVSVQFEVRDTGIGIPADKIDKIFDVFTQVEASTTRRFGGTGLGLTIVRKLVEGMGGQIAVESTPDVGSRFWFTLTLPLAPAHKQAPSSDLEPAIPTHEGKMDGRRLLLAEDNLVNQIILRKIVEKMGHTLDVAENGLDVLQRLTADSHYDLILMDVQMPVIDGLETTRRIRAGQAGQRVQDIPIVALTASAMERDHQVCLEAGMNDYLTKPVEAAQLAAHLDRWLHKDGGEARETPPPTTATEPRLFTPSTVTALVGDDVEVLRDIYTVFAADLKVRIPLLAQAVEKRDFPAGRQEAHTIKGASAYVGAIEASDIALTLELACDAEDGRTAAEAIIRFVPLAEALCAEVEAWVATLPDLPADEETTR